MDLLFDHHWISIEDDCPTGYTKKDGYIFGWETLLGKTLHPINRDECAQKCSEKPQCKSFEHSNEELKCNLNTAFEPSQRPALDYAFCSKTGKI